MNTMLGMIVWRITLDEAICLVLLGVVGVMFLVGVFFDLLYRAKTAIARLFKKKGKTDEPES